MQAGITAIYKLYHGSVSHGSVTCDECVEKYSQLSYLSHWSQTTNINQILILIIIVDQQPDWYATIIEQAETISNRGQR